MRGAPRSASGTEAIHAACASVAGCGLASGTGAAGDMSSSSAYFATVLRDTSSLRAISALGTPRASISRISCLVERGTVIFLSSRGGFSEKLSAHGTR
ncbi:MAG: hypothetical protein ACI364_02780 [Coriobacteriales bacterium]